METIKLAPCKLISTNKLKKCLKYITVFPLCDLKTLTLHRSIGIYNNIMFIISPKHSKKLILHKK